MIVVKIDGIVNNDELNKILAAIKIYNRLEIPFNVETVANDIANVLTEIYNTIDNDKDKAMVRDKIRNLIGLFD